MILIPVPAPPPRRRVHVPAQLSAVTATAHRIADQVGDVEGHVAVSDIRTALADDPVSLLAGSPQIPDDPVFLAALRMLGADPDVPPDPTHGPLVLLRNRHQLNDLDTLVLAAATRAGQPFTTRDVQLRCRWRGVSAWQLRGSIGRLVASGRLVAAGARPDTLWQVAQP